MGAVPDAARTRVPESPQGLRTGLGVRGYGPRVSMVVSGVRRLKFTLSVED
jgi:hypothetical protein